MIIALLGILDILAGISLVFPFLTFYLGISMLIKGIFSIAGSFASKFFLDFMGFIDLIVGLMLLFHFSIPFFWIFPVIKGAYSLIVGLAS